MNTALLVIDVQTLLCRGQWACHDIEAVIDRINGVIARAREAGAPVVFVQHEEAGSPMQAGSEGWQLDDRLQILEGDLRLAKTACDAFHRTSLKELLQSRGVEKLVVCGLQSEFCIDSTVRGALAQGYPVTLVSDGHSTIDSAVLSAAQISAHHNATLSSVDSYGVRVRLSPACEVGFDA